ncbi:MAG TPA: type II toxin-antitoxin system RelE/ParE family toxin [Proteobacteria bacterium]|nr:type II toxin-antitoxin system RelE/ParE family toxin [Pseudomonadota bacterium]
MKVVFTRYAKLELQNAIAFYELELPGLGRQFKEEVKKAISRIIAYPQAWSIERGEVRKCLLHRFPYKIMYSLEKDHILIIAIAHQHRMPHYWVDRKKTY